MERGSRETPSSPGGFWNGDQAQTHPGGFAWFNPYPRTGRIVDGFTFGTRSSSTRPYKADVMLVDDGTGIRLIYKGEPDGIEGEYIRAFWSALDADEIVAEDSPTTIWWPNGIYMWLIGRDELCSELTWKWDFRDCTDQEVQEQQDFLRERTGLEFDLIQQTVTGTYGEIRRRDWSGHGAGEPKWIIEVAVGVGLGIAGNSAYDLLRAAMRRIVKRLRKKGQEVDDWREPGGYL